MSRFHSRLRYTVWRRDYMCPGLRWFVSAHSKLWEAEHAATSLEIKGLGCDIYDEWDFKEEANGHTH